MTSEAGRCVGQVKQTELEALEACKWLRAAGFPQYAQMYEELQFPLDLVCVGGTIPSRPRTLCRHSSGDIRALNRCARIRLDSARKNKGDESDDDECALSGNWQFRDTPTLVQSGT
ncbi:hypothetical protein Pcinc_034762 [Petrolisthes cinctipes]|uniref:SAM domain-containing protein n=1 Tax=Petrolisthes cinctipes TaxID=88211 RepID=A0AAE1BXZ2_PETCI|nr:hypothetical protein Pcinc_034762 [Petrolisthes cinctipes]